MSKSNRENLQTASSASAEWPRQFTKIAEAHGGHCQVPGEEIITPSDYLVYSVMAGSFATRYFMVVGRFAFPTEAARAAAELEFISLNAHNCNMTFDSVTSPASAAVE